MGTVIDRTGPFSVQLWNAGCVRDDGTLQTEGPWVPARTPLTYDGVAYDPAGDQDRLGSEGGPARSALNEALALFEPYTVRWRDCVATALNAGYADPLHTGFAPLTAVGDDWEVPPAPATPEPPGPEGDRPEDEPVPGPTATHRTASKEKKPASTGKAAASAPIAIGPVVPQDRVRDEEPVPLPEGGPPPAAKR